MVTFAELRHGIERLPAGGRRRRLDEWLRQDLALRFDTRIIGVDGAIADECGQLVARREARAAGPCTPWMRSLPPRPRSMT